MRRDSEGRLFGDSLAARLGSAGGWAALFFLRGWVIPRNRGAPDFVVNNAMLFLSAVRDMLFFDGLCAEPSRASPWPAQREGHSSPRPHAHGFTTRLLLLVGELRSERYHVK